MNIISLNVNDFGGKKEHREEYKNKYGNSAYLKKWDILDKSEEVDGIYSCIETTNPKPHIIILQEFDINSKEAICFKRKMESLGYILKSEIPSKRPSMTAFFIASSLKYKIITDLHEKNLRAYAIDVEENGFVVYGTHVPPIYDNSFWNEMKSFVQKHIDSKLVLIGDFNTINQKNREEFYSILNYGLVDVWSRKGNVKGISKPGDYVLVSNKISIDEVGIQSKQIVFSDHPMILVSLP